MGLFSRRPIRVQVLLKGRIGETWLDVDRTFEFDEGSTLAQLVEAAEAAGVPLRSALERSPHLKHTAMINGERCAIDQQLNRPLVDGDQLYLLAPITAG